MTHTNFRVAVSQAFGPSQEVAGSSQTRNARARARWSVLPLLSGLERYQAEWTALNQRLNQGHPLTSFDFIHALAHQFADPTDWLAVCVRGQEVVGAVPLKRLPMRWCSFLPAQAQMSALLIAEPELLCSLIGALPGPTVCLDLLAVDPHYGPALDTWARRVSESSLHATTLNVDLRGGYAEYWQSRSRSLRDDVKNKWNRLRKDGRVHAFQALSGPDDIPAALARYAAMEGQSWKAEQGTALTLGTAQGDFYADLLARFTKSGGVTVYELTIDKELAASEIVIRSGRMSVLLKTAHDASLQRYAPGYLLDQLVLESEFNLGASDVVEFYTSANEAKLRWGTEQRDIRHLRLYRNAAIAWLVKLWRQIKREPVAATAG